MELLIFNKKCVIIYYYGIMELFCFFAGLRAAKNIIYIRQIGSLRRASEREYYKNMEFLKSCQLALMLFLSGGCAVLALLVLFSKSIPKNIRLSLGYMETCSALLLIADRYSYIYRGDVSELGYFMVRLCNFSVFFLFLCLTDGFNRYLKYILSDNNDTKKAPALLKAADVLVMIGMVMLVISHFTGFYYYFDEFNRYQRGAGIAWGFALPLAILIFQLAAIIRDRQKLSKGVFVSIMMFATVPFIASCVQLFTYGLSLINISTVGLATVLYIISLKALNERLTAARKHEIQMLKEEQELMQMMFDQTTSALADAIDAKDKYTHGHSRRVADYSVKIAEYAGMTQTECREIYYAALLHDVGKIGIAEDIITKNSKLTDDEFESIKNHPVIGRQILANISISPYLSIGASYHHERYDGKGYPYGLKGEDIPEIARIIAVADTYDAMASKRSYRDPLPQHIVREEIAKASGTQLDPEYAEIMLHLIDLDKDYQMVEKVTEN